MTKKSKLDNILNAPELSLFKTLFNKDNIRSLYPYQEAVNNFLTDCISYYYKLEIHNTQSNKDISIENTIAVKTLIRTYSQFKNAMNEYKTSIETAQSNQATPQAQTPTNRATDMGF